MRNVEVCCSSVDAVREAIVGGAIRAELCSVLSCGGVTPSAGMIMEASRLCKGHMKLHILIRPREGNFCYNDSEVNTMLADIRFCHRVGVDGVVIGALTEEGDIDMTVCRRMMEEAEGMSVTFHRAFDVCRSAEEALEQIISLGCDRLLTSGQEESAHDGTVLIAKLVKQAASRIIIMPGAGINPSNIAEIEHATSATEFHSSARRNGRTSQTVVAELVMAEESFPNNF